MTSEAERSDEPEPAFKVDWDTIISEYEDPTDANHEHIERMRALQNANINLPKGWRRNPKCVEGEPGIPPYVHDDGRVSWKNPALDQIVEFMDNESKKFDRWDTSERALVSKYERMIKSGVPIQAVQQTAKLDGADPALVEFVVNGGKEPEKEASNDTSKSANALPEHAQRRYLKKYRMMLKTGIPLHAVEQTARIDGVDPSCLSDLVSTDEDGQKTVTLMAIKKDKATLMKKYKRMFKSGVHVNAIKSMISREIGANEVDGIIATLSAEAEKMEVTSDTEGGDEHFKVLKDQGKVELALGAVGKESHLSLLVRKMALTVKRGKFGGSGDKSTLQVDMKDLFDALGGFRGVQASRDLYNSTCTDAEDMSESEIRSKRKPLLELLSSLGIRAPTRQNDKVQIKGLNQLVESVEDYYKETLAAINDSLKIGMYDFDSLSQVYKPGTRVVAKNVFASGVDMICEVGWNRYEQGKTLFGVSRYFKVCFQFIVAVGEHFTMCEFVEGMESFEGRRYLKSLNFVPFSAYDADTAAKMVSAFRKRGEMYAQCATTAQFMAYDKGSFYAKGGRSRGGDQTAALRLAGRVMIDTQGSYEAGHSLSIASNDLMVTGIKYKYKEYMLHMRAVKQAKGDKSPPTDDNMVLFDEIPDDYLEMTWPAVIGFSFTSKTWGEVLVDGLSDIKFDESVFDNLVLPASRKRMVKALVRHSNDAFHDIISGKGEGSVFLLYGPPGCGKTLTAEAISEMLHRPLYSVSLGQLGVTPTELETKLSEILDLCSKWDALILLDEADIFLEKRSSTGSLERNAMVSVMLRLVEYFKGVLFLTSNRVDALDPAFKTRITLALRYETLNPSARKQVWINLLQSSGFSDSMKDGVINVDELAENELNGREIKNAIRLGMALAEEDREPLSQKLLLETIETLNDFNQKMNSAEAY